MIERWHRTLKAALIALGASNNWTRHLPTVLLGLRTALGTDSDNVYSDEFTGGFGRSKKIALTLIAEEYGICLLTQKRVMSEDFMAKGITINTKTYCESAKNEKKRIKDERRERLNRGVFLLNDSPIPLV
ncbi:hypothetical protein AAG570_012667 [Ranatra chinensis]|uniref:Uncharacterized protein n=1 Tax=Ranatra chinensis TaxID=642074 RepID=A0ABD0YEJ0_9HEMI